MAARRPSPTMLKEDLFTKIMPRLEKESKQAHPPEQYSGESKIYPIG